ncbi:helix-turn-helix domain-containing protein [Companilactobacillus alimentarius]|uniref:helix-turn-helix domain-containing protein n=1 Tax=Companilactobacillus alimentarius TaxID=1602 RepID=UPI0028B61C4E|nr:helix-turn-helix domain-containing protein [Companilactobacillus alimentarius]MDT6952213.1 helix-turn-helix domain-containing protein [Companilactobacillus alimentarius]
MVKYSSKLKAEVVGEYLQGRTSMQSLSEKHNLPKRQVSFWIQKYRLSGVDSLKRKKN